MIAAAKEYGAHGVGIDINPERIQEAEGNAKTAGVESWCGSRRTIYLTPTFTTQRL